MRQEGGTLAGQRSSPLIAFSAAIAISFASFGNSIRLTPKDRRRRDFGGPTSLPSKLIDEPLPDPVGTGVTGMRKALAGSACAAKPLKTSYTLPSPDKTTTASNSSRGSVCAISCACLRRAVTARRRRQSALPRRNEKLDRGAHKSRPHDTAPRGIWAQSSCGSVLRPCPRG